jgi:hypothetical protein
MTDAGGIGPAIAIALLLVVMLWFTFGTQRNIRKGNAVLTWLQGGLPRIGPRTTLRWLGSSAVELTIVDARDPFRDMTVIVVLEPRDVGLLWAFARSRGRRDFVIFRGNLRRPPRSSAEVGDPVGWTGRLASESEPGWRQTTWPEGVIAKLDANADETLVRSAWDRLAASSDGVWRLTVQPVVPHLEAHIRPPDPDRVPAERLIGELVDFAERVSRG